MPTDPDSAIELPSMLTEVLLLKTMPAAEPGASAQVAVDRSGPEDTQARIRRRFMIS